MRKVAPYLYCVILIVSLGACSKQSELFSQSASSQSVTLPGDDKVLAKVNGSPITRYDLDSTIQRMLGEYQSSLLDKNGRQQALESMTASRAMSQAALKEMPAEDLAVIEKQVSAYKEKLLVSSYLKAHATVQPVTDEMVKEYYAKNPDRFGAKKVRRYDMLFGAQKLQTGSRDQIMHALAKAGQAKDWRQQSEILVKQGYSLQYRQGNMDEKLLNPRLRRLMRSLDVGQSSDVTFIEGKPYIVRIISEEEIPPRPLNEVSAEIRRSLVPVQLKKAVKTVSKELLKSIKVEYLSETGESGA